VLPLIIFGIAAVAVAGIVLYEVLTHAEDDANKKFSSKPIGDPIQHCPLKQEGAQIVSDAQAQRANDKFDKLPDDEKKKFQDILRNAKSDEERMYIWKAFGACHSTGECSAFADKIRGKDPKWLNDNCRLTGSSDGTGIQQQWSHSCNATTAQAVRGEMDPIYSLKEHEDNPNWGSVDDTDATKDNPNLAAEQKKMLESEYTGSASGRHKGVAADRGSSAAGSGRWASDLFNDPAEQTGVTYVTKKDPSTTDALQAIDSGVASGVPVPIVIGNGAGKYTHYVLVTGSDPGPPKTYTIHDPWSGKTVTRTDDDIKNGKIDIAGSNQITAVEDPQLQSATPATKATC
jgi:hypothetical protein